LLEGLDSVNIPVIVGSSHPTVAPEEVIAHDRVNMICIGEGELAIAELASKLANEEDIRFIPNLWVKKDGEIFKNELRPLIQDLDTLPYPNWGLFDDRHIVRSTLMRGEWISCRVGVLETSRGCPYSCTYCINAFLQDKYRKKGKYHREKTVARVGVELSYLKKEHDLDYFNFIDETLLLNVRRLAEFSKMYRSEIKLPFSFMTRPEGATEEAIKLMAEAGADIVKIGIEAGNEEFREKVLNRHATNEDIIRAFELTKKYGLIAYSFNMVGLPFENRKLIGETIELNRKIKPDRVQATIFFPFPGTKLLDESIKNNFIKDHREVLGSEIITYYGGGILTLPGLSPRRIYRIACLFRWYVKSSRLFHPIIILAEKAEAVFKLWQIFEDFARLVFKKSSVLRKHRFKGVAKRG